MFRKSLPKKFMGVIKLSMLTLTTYDFLDPHNSIAGLVAKGKAKNDFSGFVLDA